jgi:RNA polymerase sigma factor (sigma-70 family)
VVGRAIAPILQGIRSADADKAWVEFLDLYGPILYHTALAHTANEDAAADCYVHICQRLADHRFKRLLKFNLEGKASFVTWLRVVGRNLCFDWHRIHSGRHRPFKALSDLSPVELEVYKLRFTQGVSEGETFEEIRKLFPAIAADELFAIEEKLEKSLTARQRWLLSSRRQPYLSSAVAVAGEEETDPITIEPADSQPNQEIVFATAEQKAQLRRLLASLPPTERLLLQLRFEQELSLDEVARLCGLGDGQRAHRKITAVLKKLRFALE